MKSMTVAALAGAISWFAAGCTATTPAWESQFGDTVRQTRSQQVIDPEAAQRITGPAQTDAKAVAGAQKAYAESYGYAIKESKPATLTLLPGGSGQ